MLCFLYSIFCRQIVKKWHNRNYKIKKITKQNLGNEYILISLDVVSLYTNIPVNLAFDNINQKWKEIEQYTDIPKNEFIVASKLCLESTYFSYNNEFYKQNFGIAMGSPLSASIANLVMESLEDNCISNLIFSLPFYKRYVDDILTAVKHENVNNILNCFNNYNINLKFTAELENNKGINF